MIEKEGRKIYITCDVCHKREFVRELTGIDILKMNVKFPEGWSEYNEFNHTKMTFCSDKKCQEFLNELCRESDKKADRKLSKENWSKQLIS